MTTPAHTNRLASETSPYLLQHAHNPVDWYPWGEEAFARARTEDKPIFLSIGYSACHWCHVMERESFENEAIAAVLNREFVSIKVDREERPDVDSIYMQAVQMMSGHGGWPMSMFLTPEGVPFYGGTYFPPEDRRGLPGFGRILEQISDAYRFRQGDVRSATEEIRNALTTMASIAREKGEITRGGLDHVAKQIGKSYDPIHGGFGSAPKFPPSMTLDFLMQVAARTGDSHYSGIVTTTLEKMARGGIYDQIGGGFHRYSTDARWLVPHFEKMLYDNALLARLYVRGWQWTRDSELQRIARETLGFVQREMTSPEGGFYSTLDADTEGEEGRFYVWQRSEIMSLLGETEGRAFCALFDITDRGNWEGANILNVPRDPEVVAGDLGISEEQLLDIASRGKCHLFGERSKRVGPGRDEKILAGWNGWMLAAFAEAAMAFGEPKFLAVTRANADFLMSRMLDGTKLYRSYKEGHRKIGGLLEDYAGVAWGLIAAYEALQDPRCLETAKLLAVEMLGRFRDHENGGFFDTPTDHEKLITRPKDLFDNATPSGNSLAVDVLLRLALYFGDETFDRVARESLQAGWPLADKYPSGFGMLLCAAEWSTAKPKEVAITGSGDDAAVQALWRAFGETYLPHRIVASTAAPQLPLMEGRSDDRLAAYVCEGYACKEPTADPARFAELLRA